MILQLYIFYQTSGIKSQFSLSLGFISDIPTNTIKLAKSPGIIGVSPKNDNEVFSNNITTILPTIKDAIVPSIDDFFQ